MLIQFYQRPVYAALNDPPSGVGGTFTDTSGRRAAATQDGGRDQSLNRDDGSVNYSGAIYGTGGQVLPGQGQLDSSVGPQRDPTYHIRKALMQMRRTSFFQQIADTMTMPKHTGKEVDIYEYYPILDDRNINDQGIDATGARYLGGNLYGTSRDIGKITAYMPHLGELSSRVNRVGITRIVRKSGIRKLGLFMEYDRDSNDFDMDPNLQTIRTTELMVAANDIVEDLLQKDLLNCAGITMYAIDPTTDNTNRANDLNNGDIDKAIANLGITLSGTVATSRTALLAAVNAADRTEGSIRKAIYANTTLVDSVDNNVELANQFGNYLVYESFKKVPVTRSVPIPGFDATGAATPLSGATRSDNAYPYDNPFNVSIDRYKGDSRNLTIRGEVLPLLYPADQYKIADTRNTASNNWEDRFGDFTAVSAKLPGGLDRKRVNSEVTYQDLANLASILNQNRVKTSTKMITGSTMVDTKTLEKCWVMYVGPQVEKLLRRMKAPNGEDAFTDASQYGAAATIMAGEIGNIDRFRFVVPNEMIYYAGAGADVPSVVSFKTDIDRTANDINRPGHYYSSTEGKFDVFPMLFVGDASFTNIGFKSSMGQGKFNFNHKKPGEITPGSPYGVNGVMSVQWWMGTLVKRPEHIALINTIAPK